MQAVSTSSIQAKPNYTIEFSTWGNGKIKAEGVKIEGNKSPRGSSVTFNLCDVLEEVFRTTIVSLSIDLKMTLENL